MELINELIEIVKNGWSVILVAFGIGGISAIWLLVKKSIKKILALLPQILRQMFNEEREAQSKENYKIDLLNKLMLEKNLFDLEQKQSYQILTEEQKIKNGVLIEQIKQELLNYYPPKLVEDEKIKEDN
jgi:hypothetical protein